MAIDHAHRVPAGTSEVSPLDALPHGNDAMSGRPAPQARRAPARISTPTATAKAPLPWLSIAWSVVPTGGLVTAVICLVRLIGAPASQRRRHGVPIITFVVSHAVYLFALLAFVASLGAPASPGYAHIDGGGNVVVGTGANDGGNATAPAGSDEAFGSWYYQYKVNGYQPPTVDASNQDVIEFGRYWIVTVPQEYQGNGNDAANGVIDPSSQGGPLSLVPVGTADPNQVASLPDNGQWFGGPGDAVRCVYGAVQRPSLENIQTFRPGWIRAAHSTVTVDGQSLDRWLFALSDARPADCPAN